MCYYDVISRRGKEMNWIWKRKTILLIKHLDDQPKVFFFYYYLFSKTLSPPNSSTWHSECQGQKNKKFFLEASSDMATSWQSTCWMKTQRVKKKNVWQYRFTDGDEMHECVDGKTTVWRSTQRRFRLIF